MPTRHRRSAWAGTSAVRSRFAGADCKRTATAGAAALLAALAVGCGGGSAETGTTSPQAKAKPEKPPGLGIEHVGKFDEPIYVTQPPSGDEDLYVVERAGKVVRVAPDGSTSAFLDIHGVVTTEGEGAMVSIAFPPDFAKSGLFYVSYAGRDKHLHLDEYRVADSGPDLVAPTSRRTVLSIPHPEIIHWGGLAVFGPDGHLYVGTGDGGPDSPIPTVAQDRKNLLGKILRIDPEEPGPGLAYGIPKDNPFVGKSGADEVFAYGLRNPWRYSFDRKTGDLWIGDVGDFTREEIDHTTLQDAAAANFGWPILEGEIEKSGAEAPDSLTAPALTYKRTGHPNDAVCAVTGGYVERDSTVPKLHGQYIYADFCAGKILSVPIDARHPKPSDTGLSIPRLASFGEDASGRIYATSLDGQVFRIVQR